MNNIHVLAVDSSEASEEAFKWACKSLPNQDKFMLVHGFKERTPIMKGGPAGMEQTDDINETLSEQVISKKFMSLCRENNRTCSFTAASYLSADELGRKICDLAKKNKADSVVCSTRALSGFSRALLGSTSGAILHHCDCQVTVIKGAKKD